MEHFIRIAFWIVTLSVCHRAKSLPISESNIDLMREHVKCPADSKFYTPSNVKDQCITAAMDCFEKELKTVVEECEGPPNFIYQAREFLIVWVRERSEKEKGNVPKTSAECACENWTETPFSNFLNKMESLLQQANTAAST